MRVFKALVKLGLIAAAVAAAIAVTAVVMKGRARHDIEIDEWPEVPVNPAA
ncbi:MAG: hypothetical protein ACP5OV_08045 [Acidimicrobiales bacterium]